MATTGVVGGSSIDVPGLVSQLVAAERKPLDDQIAREKTRLTTQISALGSLMGNLSAFQTTLNGLKTEAAFSARKATSADEDIVTATVSNSAAPGAYQVEVEQLASAQQLASTAFAGGSSQVVGTGTLTLSLGSASFSVQIDSSNSTVAGIRDAINSAAGNTGVHATIINASDGAHLVLTSAKTGADNFIQVSQSGGDGNLSRLTYSSLDQANYTELVEANDSIVRVGTYESRSSTNVNSTLIDGVTLNLRSAEPGTTVNVSVTLDVANAKTRITEFVNSYNTLRKAITALGGYNAATQSGGPMQGDAMLSGIDAELRRTLSSGVEGATGAYRTLADIGITTQADGTLKIDASKLDTALGADFAGVGKLFGSATGVAARLHGQISDRLADGAALDTRSDNLSSAQRALEKRQADINVRMQTVQARYLKQFTQLDTLLSSLSSTSAFLSQQIESLSNLNKRD